MKNAKKTVFKPLHLVVSRDAAAIYMLWSSASRA